MKSNDIYHRRGWWWSTMGFTRTHIVAVFFTECLLGTVGAILAIAAITGMFKETVAWLLIAVCIFLLQLSVLLSSILSLLFYIGSRVERSTDKKSEDEKNVVV